MIVPLNDLKEQSGSVLHDFGEDLKQVTIVIVIDQNVKFLKLKREKIGKSLYQIDDMMTIKLMLSIIYVILHCVQLKIQNYKKNKSMFVVPMKTLHSRST